jgi:hypothetical protein
MNLTYDDFRNGESLYRGKLAERFPFDGGEIYKLPSEEYFIRTDQHIIPITGFNPEIQLYRIKGRLVLRFLDNDSYTYIKAVKVLEYKTLKQFDGFEPGKLYEFTNGQVWQQVDGPNAPNHSSSGYVRIIDDKIMMVDTWTFYPNVIQIK